MFTGCFDDLQCWVDHEKPLLKQVPLNRLQFLFLVKFYTPDPGLLEDEYTRSVLYARRRPVV